MGLIPVMAVTDSTDNNAPPVHPPLFTPDYSLLYTLDYSERLVDSQEFCKVGLLSTFGQLA